MRFQSPILGRSVALLAGWFLAWAGIDARASEFEYSLTGNAADAKPPSTEGALLLRGGGGHVDDAFRWFVKKAGGGDIVLLKATDGPGTVADTFGAYLHGSIGGCDSVEVITFKSRKAAADPRVLKVLHDAEGIFLGGGKQFLYVDYWKGTPVAAALDAHVRNGRPLGGSSAGLAVLGQHGYTAHVTARLTSATALMNPFAREITLEHDFLHFDLMRGMITDSHLMARDRLGRLIAFVSRLATDADPGAVLGIGVDEKSALCVEPNGRARVFSSSPESRVWLVLPRNIPEVMRPEEPLTWENVKVVSAGPESVVDLAQRTVTHPVAELSASVKSGTLTLSP